MDDFACTFAASRFVCSYLSLVVHIHIPHHVASPLSSLIAHVLTLNLFMTIEFLCHGFIL
ncbi:hypothetical protein K439DRAFT_1121988 [Ramaria rubella]|nr:hypothetical protein K439DRAFT_1121988 [Ramaria rubella]